MTFKEDRKRNIYDIVRVAHNDIDLWPMILFTFANNDMIFPTFSRKRKYHCEAISFVKRISFPLGNVNIVMLPLLLNSQIQFAKRKLHCCQTFLYFTWSG